MNPVVPVAEETPPTRLRALIFSGKAWLLRAHRWLNDPHGRPAPLPRGPLEAEAPLLAQSCNPLYASTTAAEFALQAGKVQNLRLAAASLHGRVLRAGEIFSFWAHVPRPTERRGFAPGRELREGCVIPSVGGGLCQLSNALYDAALTAGFEIIERHAHSRRLPGSMAAQGRDATIFWNYVDLRFRAPVDCQLDVRLNRHELRVALRAVNRPAGNAALPRKHQQPATPVLVNHPEHGAESCETCGITSCFRNPAATSLPQGSTTAWLVDAWWPEHHAWMRESRRPGDTLLTPLDRRRWKTGPYHWDSHGFAKVKSAPWFVLRRSFTSRKLASQGAARQRALLRMDQELAQIYAKRIPYTALHVVVSQNLLPFLWQSGALAGRTFDVLMTRLPLTELQRRLDKAALRWPGTKTLSDFRADPALLEAESAALAEAQHWVTPHRAIAELAGSRAVLLDWKLPAAKKAAPRKPARKIVFPASTLSRKGAGELLEAARELGIPVILAGPLTEGADFWKGVAVQPAGDDWLKDADAVVLPAWVENQPRRLLAALAAGVPVICTEACGLSEEPGVTIVREGNAEDIVRALSILDEPPQTPRFAGANLVPTP